MPEFALKKLPQKNKANSKKKNRQKTQANLKAAPKKVITQKREKIFVRVECNFHVAVCVCCSSCCHFPAFVCHSLSDFCAAYFRAHNLWPPGIKLAKAQHEKAATSSVRRPALIRPRRILPGLRTEADKGAWHTSVQIVSIFFGQRQRAVPNILHSFGSSFLVFWLPT